MQVATWNVNSIRTRLSRVLAWLEAHRPDVVCLQETKVTDDQFPRQPLEDAGYHVEVFGQKTYNGVAVLSRTAVDEVRTGFPSDPPEAARRCLAIRREGLWIINVYVPNGSHIGSDKFAHKLEWLQRLHLYLAEGFSPADEVLVCGDFNIAPEDRDVHDPDRWRGKVLFHPDEHAALRRITGWGLEDALRLSRPEAGVYTWWDYRAGSFRRDLGMRIDHILVTAPLARRCTGVHVHREERGGEKPSDHAPVVAGFR